MNKRFGLYVLEGVDESKNIHFTGVAIEGKEPLPPFVLDIASMDEGLNYQLIFPTMEGELSTEVTDAAQQTMDLFVKSALKHSTQAKQGRPAITYPCDGRAFLDKPVFSHFADDGSDNPNFGGMTIAVMFEPATDAYIFGVSFCNQTDSFSKRIGNELAWNALKDNPYLIPVQMMEEAMNSVYVCLTPGSALVINDPLEFIRATRAHKLLSLLAYLVETDSEASPLYKERFSRTCYIPRGYVPALRLL